MGRVCSAGMKGEPKASEDEPAAETRLLLAHRDLWDDARVAFLGAPASEARWLDAPRAVYLSGTEGGTPGADFERAVVYLPKGRRRRDYLIAYAGALSQTLIVVGQKRAGIKSATKQLATLGAIQETAHGSHCQLASLQLSERQPLPQLDEWVAEFEARGLRLMTLPGVFCDGRLDDGSDLLLEHLVLPDQGTLLDLGCGAGALGLWAKRQHPSLCVTLSDVDELSVESARRSAQRNELDVRCVRSDVYSALDERFDVIVSNPPFHQGVDTDYEVTQRIIGEAAAYLATGGELWLVANHFLPWREPLEAHFGRVDLVHASNRFKIWRARLPETTP